METPIVEYANLFERTLGSDSEVVMKEMYSFTDRHTTHPRKLVLRPEGTAGIMRALIEHGYLVRHGGSSRVFYTGPMFRYERPQKGRYRQFAQFGWEIFGIQDPSIDAELIGMIYHWLTRLKFNRDDIKVG